jgi:hypothetical protein
MVTHASSIEDAVAVDGFALIENFVSSEVVESLLQAFKAEALGDRAGTRQLHERAPAISEFLDSAEMKRRIDELIPRGFIVRSILFDKTPEANWRVPWHQDLSICVKERHDLPSFGAWSIKEGVQHLQPPVEILSRMLTLRLHLAIVVRTMGRSGSLPDHTRTAGFLQMKFKIGKAKVELSAARLGKVARSS